MNHVSEVHLLLYRNRDGQTCFRYRDDTDRVVHGQLSQRGRDAITELLSEAVERVEGREDGAAK